MELFHEQFYKASLKLITSKKKLFDLLRDTEILIFLLIAENHSVVLDSCSNLQKNLMKDDPNGNIH